MPVIHGRLQESGLNREHLLSEIFEACDDDQSGYLNLGEYLQLFQSREMSDETAINSFLAIDACIHADGKITREEFVKW